MKLHQLVDQFIVYRRSLGERCQSNARLLRAFCRSLPHGIDINKIGLRQTKRYLYGKGPVTSAWHGRHNALKGFFGYAVSRNYVRKVPLPRLIPQRPPPFVPYIYTRAEVRRLLKATGSYQRNRSCMEPETVRVIILLLYATGMRMGEALALNHADVDLDQSMLTVVRSKFFKTRLVPFSPRLGQVLQRYLTRPKVVGWTADPASPFFTTRRGTRINSDTLEDCFRRVCQQAGVRRNDGARYQPRLHDLRHAFTVHRLIAWYRKGKDVQRLLPQLSVYLGHVHLAATQVYLTLTPELLHQANQRFEQYTKQKLSRD